MKYNVGDKVATRNAYGNALVEFGNDENIVVLDADVDKSESKVILRSLSGDNLRMDETSVKVLSLEGETLATKSQIGDSGYLKPGETVHVTVDGTIPNAGNYVEVSVIVDGKHIVLSKEVLVKA